MSPPLGQAAAGSLILGLGAGREGGLGRGVHREVEASRTLWPRLPGAGADPPRGWRAFPLPASLGRRSLPGAHTLVT